MSLKDRVQAFFERLSQNNANRSGSRLGAWFIFIACGAVVGWIGYSIFFIPVYKKEFTPQKTAYSTPAVKEISLPVEQAPPPPPPPRQEQPKTKAPEARAIPKPQAETLAQKCRRMARLHSQYSGPFSQSWKVSDCLPQDRAQDAETRPQQTLEVPPAQQIRNESRQPGFLQPPESPYMVMRGSVIPVVLLDGFDTQVAGQITARVVRDVMDTRTGRHVMIPQDSWVNGHYDINLPYDQDRVPTGWDELVLPSGETMDLLNFTGADTNGAAGTPVDVDTHFWRTAGRSLLLTITGAAAGVARHGAYENGDYNGADALADHGGRQMDRRSRELWDRGGYRGPTGKAKKGEVFLLQVTSSLTFPPGDYYERNGMSRYAGRE